MWEALTQCGSVEVVAFVDADSRLCGRTRAGLPVHPPDWLSTFTGDIVVADTAGACVPASLLRSVTADRLVRLPVHLDNEALARIVTVLCPDPLAPLLAAPAVRADTRAGIFGTGAAATKVWEALADIDECEPIWFADNNVGQQGREFLWLPVIAPADIPMRETDVVVIGSMSRDPIRHQLVATGLPSVRILAPDVCAPVDDIRSELRRQLSSLTPREVLA
jgi:FlaA1/EpsC-like NDP-sugar epimerase